jgi:signal transduction histidine kinase
LPPPVSFRVTSKGPQRASRFGGSGVIALVALLTPALVFAVILLVVAIWETGQAARSNALERARAVISQVDAELQHEIRALKAVADRLSGVPILRTRPVAENAALNAELFPQWIGSIVWAKDEGRALYSSLPGEDLPRIPSDWRERIDLRDGPLIDGVATIGGVSAVMVHIPVPDDPRNLILTTAIRPDTIRDILMNETPAGSVSGVVDREGDFIGRSIDHDRRLGTPATIYVRNAVARGGEGTYRGRTYEGFENVSAYATSPLTGWSAHMAISKGLIGGPAPLAMMVAIAGGLLSLGFAGSLIWLILRDARRRRATERAIDQAQRVESMGRLTGGIAHDFNNLLTVIIGSLERSRSTNGAARDNKPVEDALAAARRAASLTRSLLIYSRQQPLAAEVIDLNACVRDAADVIRRTLGEAYRVETEFDDQAGAVRVDAAQLSSALLNLAVNARDAMEGGGAITLRTSRRKFAHDDAELGVPAGDYARVSVSDTGPGMPPDVARRAFEPFFTTKDVGRGTGLGLAQVDGFARQSGGAAELETAPGEGVTVALTFPRVADAPAKTEASEAPVTVPPQKPLRVLLVEDEEGVREHASSLLASLGHTVTACDSAAAARKALDAQRFDLLFSDIVLPGGVSGVALAEEASARQPDMAVLLATGYAGDELAGHESR